MAKHGRLRIGNHPRSGKTVQLIGHILDSQADGMSGPATLNGTHLSIRRKVRQVQAHITMTIRTVGAAQLGPQVIHQAHVARIILSLKGTQIIHRVMST